MNVSYNIYIIIINCLFLIACTCPKDEHRDHVFTSYQSEFINGILNKNMVFLDSSGIKYYIKTGSPITTPTTQNTQDDEHHVGMLSCRLPNVFETTYETYSSIESTIPNFKWNDLHFKNNYNEVLNVVMHSKDSILITNTSPAYNPPNGGYHFISITGSLNENQGSISSTLFLKQYVIASVTKSNVNVIVTDKTIPDSLFWTKEEGFIKFVSRDKNVYYRIN